MRNKTLKTQTPEIWFGQGDGGRMDLFGLLLNPVLKLLMPNHLFFTAGAPRSWAQCQGCCDGHSGPHQSLSWPFSGIPQGGNDPAKCWAHFLGASQPVSDSHRASPALSSEFHKDHRCHLGKGFPSNVLKVSCDLIFLSKFNSEVGSKDLFWSLKRLKVHSCK